MTSPLRCRYGEKIDLTKRQGHDYRIPQGADMAFEVEILDTVSANWQSYACRSQLRRNFRDKAPVVVGEVFVSKLNAAPGANKTFWVRISAATSDAIRALVGSWDIELFNGSSTLRPVSESKWVLSQQTTE